MPPSFGVLLLGPACSRDKAEPNPDRVVNVPKSAVRELSIFPGAVLDSAFTAPSKEVYRVAGETPENVVTFYRSGLGFNDPNDSFDACTETLTPPYELTWRVPDTNDFVVVQVEGDGAEQPGSVLTMIDDKANTTRSCDVP